MNNAALSASDILRNAVAVRSLRFAGRAALSGSGVCTSATGAGLGLAIVEKAMQRMGGSLELSLATDGGLVAQIRLKRAT